MIMLVMLNIIIMQPMHIMYVIYMNITVITMPMLMIAEIQE